MTRERATKSSLLASAVLALAMMGDSLLYAVLPLNAAEFGITLAGVGVLLSANRIVRLFLFHRFAAAARRWGLRRMTMVAAVLGGLSTIAVALSAGMPALLGARIAWGVAFGTLALTTLGYAMSSAEGAGARVGWSLSIREAGPLVAYTAGVAIAASMGARGALLILGLASLLAIPLALMLPHDGGSAKQFSADRRTGSTQGVTRHELIACAMGLVIDGVFVTTIGLLYAAREGLTGAAAFAAMALAGRRLAVLVLAPLAGRVGDRFGARRTLATSLGVAAAAVLMLGVGVMVAGVAILVSAAAFAGTVLPLSGQGAGRWEDLNVLARLNAARDLGAAIGPMVGVALLATLGGAQIYALSGALLASMALVAGVGRRNAPEAHATIRSLDIKTLADDGPG